MKVKEHEMSCLKFCFISRRQFTNLNKLVIVSVFRDARVVKDMTTGKSKGYGFVSFFNKWVSSIRSACVVLEESRMEAEFICRLPFICPLLVSLRVGTHPGGFLFGYLFNICFLASDMCKVLIFRL